MDRDQFRRDPSTPTDAQREAAEEPGGYVLIQGIHGSGKTRTLVYRVEDLVDRGVPTAAIECVSCTIHGAGDLERRLESNETTRAYHQEITVWTWEPLALWILRTPGVPVPGVPRDCPVWDREQADEVFSALVRAHISPVPKPAPIRRAIDWHRRNRSRSADEPLPPEEPWWRGAADTFSREKRTQGVLDVDDLIPAAIRAVEEVPGIAALYRRRPGAHWLVDDFEEITPAAYDLLILLAGPGGSVTVAVNPDEAVGVHPGSSPAMLRRFLLEPGPRGPHTYRLTTNQRSGPLLARAADHIAPHASMAGPKGGQPTPEPNFGKRARLVVVEGRPEDQYQHMLTEALWRHGQLRQPWEEMAVIYDRPSTFDQIRTMAIGSGIPYTLLGGDAYQDGDGRSILSMLQLLSNPEDFAAFCRAASTVTRPPRRLDSGAAEAVYRTARSRRIDLVRAARACLDDQKINSKRYRDLRYVTDAWNILEGMLRNPATSLHDLCGAALRLLHDAQQVGPGGPNDSQAQLLLGLARVRDMDGEPLRRVIATLSDFVNSDLSGVCLSGEKADPFADDRGITFSTIRAAAGLEWRTVFLPNARDDIYPGKLAVDDAEGRERALRTFKLASTRARVEMTYYCPLISGETWNAQPTRFLEGLGNDLLERTWVGSRDPW